MKQILHIFRKDCRHLRPRIAVVLLLVVAHAVFAVRSVPFDIPQTGSTNTILGLLSMLLPLAMWFLIASAILEETLPGDRQFWLTRPYRRLNLLAAKVLFILVFVSVPLFFSDCYILAIQSFAVFEVLPALLLRQLLLAALFILPSFAIATVASGLAQFLFGWFVLLLAVVFEVILASLMFRANNGGVAFDTSSGSSFMLVLVITTCAVILWQYARRRTTVARAALLIVTCGFLPVTFGLARLNRGSAVTLDRPNSGRPDVQVTYELGPNARRLASGERPSQGFVEARIPLNVTGLPSGTLLRGPGAIAIKIAGKSWPQHDFYPAAFIERISDTYWVMFDLPVAGLDALKQQPIDLHSSLDLEIVTDEVYVRARVSKRVFFVPGVGLCRTFEVGPQFLFSCRAGLGPSVETTVRSEFTKGQEEVISEFPARPSIPPAGLSPTTDLGTVNRPSLPRLEAELSFVPRHSVAELHRSLDAKSIQLRQYILPDKLSNSGGR